MTTKCKKPVLPQGGQIPVVVSNTTQIQNALIISGTLHGGEAIEDGTLHGGEAIQSGTLHSKTLNGGTLCATIYSPATYRTKDGKAYFKFKYVDLGKIFEIDILSQPSYNGFKDSSSVAHWLPSSRGGKKICVAAGHEPKTLQKAKQISIEWAELTYYYSKTGKIIDDQIADRNKKNGGSFLSRLFR